MVLSIYVLLIYEQGKTEWIGIRRATFAHVRHGRVRTHHDLVVASCKNCRGKHFGQKPSQI
jgi:hypothetical protein